MQPWTLHRFYTVPVSIRKEIYFLCPCPGFLFFFLQLQCPRSKTFLINWGKVRWCMQIRMFGQRRNFISLCARRVWLPCLTFSDPYDPIRFITCAITFTLPFFFCKFYRWCLRAGLRELDHPEGKKSWGLKARIKVSARPGLLPFPTLLRLGRRLCIRGVAYWLSKKFVLFFERDDGHRLGCLLGRVSWKRACLWLQSSWSTTLGSNGNGSTLSLCEMMWDDGALEFMKVSYITAICYWR